MRRLARRGSRRQRQGAGAGGGGGANAHDIKARETARRDVVLDGQVELEGRHSVGLRLDKLGLSLEEAAHGGVAEVGILVTDNEAQRRGVRA